MLEAARKIAAFTHGGRRRDLDDDELLALAVVRLLEILGEAANSVTPTFANDQPNIPWRSLSGMRNRLIHGYFSVDLDIVWQVITSDLPPLIAALETLLGKVDDMGSS